MLHRSSETTRRYILGAVPDALQRAVSCALGFSWTLDCERVLAGGVSR